MYVHAFSLQVDRRSLTNQPLLTAAARVSAGTAVADAGIPAPRLAAQFRRTGDRLPFSARAPSLTSVFRSSIWTRGQTPRAAPCAPIRAFQPLDGSPGRQTTNFKSGTFQTFGWSPNGESFAIIREGSQSDVVLMRSLDEAGSR